MRQRNALLYGGKYAFVHQHVLEKNATHLYTESVATELRSSNDDSGTRPDMLADGLALAWSNVWAAWLYSSFLEASKYSLFTNLTTMTAMSLSGCACCSSLPVTKMLSSHAIVLGLSRNPGPAGSREIRHMT